jgi:hypothetical protein
MDRLMKSPSIASELRTPAAKVPLFRSKVRAMTQS